MRAALAGLDIDLDKLRNVEPDAALGNGGLGRLAACFMESMATLSHRRARLWHPLRPRPVPPDHQSTAGSTNIPRTGCDFGNPWEFPRPEVDLRHRLWRRRRQRAAPARLARAGLASVRDGRQAVAYDTPVVGWRGAHVNTLRLWSARAPDPLRLDVFNQGDYVGALVDQVRAESISKVLYPSDSTPAGQELRLAAGIFLRLRLAAGPDPPPSANSTAISTRSPTRSRSSSTTPIRRSASPN